MEHTKGKLYVAGNAINVKHSAGGFVRVASVDGGDSVFGPNARRFVKCWTEHDTLKAKAALHDELVKCCEGVLDFLEYRKDDLKHLGEAEVRRQILRRVLAKAKEIK